MKLRRIIILLVIIMMIVLMMSCVGSMLFARDMEMTISWSKELVPAEGITVVPYSFNYPKYDSYSKLNRTFEKMEKKESLVILRIFCIEGNRCLCAAKKLGGESNTLLLISADVNGGGYETIGNYDMGSRYLYDPSGYGSAEYLHFQGDDVQYSQLIAFYYNGKIVINAEDSVVEYDISSGTTNEQQKADYTYPEIETRLFIQGDDSLIIRHGAEKNIMSFAKILDSSSEMRFLYELTIKQGYPELETHRYLYSIVYYNAEPYVVFRPISRWGISFGALFKYDAENQCFIYIDCCNTNDVPHDVYPVFVN